MRLTINVTSEDKLLGEVDSYFCPVARAIRRELKKVDSSLDCYVVTGRVTIYWPKPGFDMGRVRILLPRIVGDWVMIYDLSRGGEGNPFEFVLVIPIAEDTDDRQV